MKRISVLIFMLGVTAAGLSAQQFILTGQWAMQGSDQNVISSAKAGEVINYGGIGTELLFRHIGFGSSLMVAFQDRGEDLWTNYWDLRMFMSYHFFSPRAFLDPYVQAGGGAYGDVTVAGDMCSGDLAMADNVNLAFYPYLAAGLGLRFRGGLYTSGQFNWRPVAQSLPCCDTVGTPVHREFELVVSVGYAFGGRR